MAGHIGKLEQFNDSVESWISYEERLEQYFRVNEIKNEKKVSAPLTLIGGKTYGLLRNLTAPEKPADKSFDDLCKLLKDHLAPKPLVIVERFRFHKRNQAVSESINDFVAELRRLSEHCEFGDVLNDTLRDRFVCGPKDQNIQRKLLSKSGLTFQKAVEEAVAMETASKDATELRTVENVHKTVKSKFPAKKNDKPKQTEKCKHCGKTNHSSNKCFFRTKQCYICKKTGHIKSMCKTPQASRVKSVEESENEIFIINSVNGRQSKKITISPEINGKTVKMELDTGSSVSLMSHKQFRELFGNKVKLSAPDSTLKTYSGETIEQMGTYRPTVSYNGHKGTMKLCIVKKDGPALFGRDWLNSIKVDWENIFQVHTARKESSTATAEQLQSILKKYPDVFSEGIGKVNGIKAKLILKDNAKPVFKKARPVPISLKPKIEQELDNLERQGIISKVKSSEWATPIVPVVKSDGSVRICGDFKVSLNQELRVDKYPMPNIQDISVNLANGQKFSKIDLRQAYLQLECEDDSKQLLTINTHKGLYSYNRLLYGVASAPAIWQRTIEQILNGISGVQVILDDMVVTGSTDEQHLETLDTVLFRLNKYGVKVNVDKCDFFKDRINYCGHEIDSEGMWKSKAKVGAILDTPSPTDVSSLRAYIGLLMYYNKYLENVSTVIKPLTELLEKNRKFEWTDIHERAFRELKRLLMKEPVLTHYNHELPVRLACDASPVGISGILSHVMPDGSEKVIAYASRTLTKTERKYAQYSREALAVYWSVKKFYTYLYGRKFTLISDCQSLMSIFSPKKDIPITTEQRVTRYALYLSGFDYDIEHKSSKKNSNVDGLSRLPVPTEQNDNLDELEVFYTSQIEQLPVTSAQIARETRRDKTLSRVMENVQNGWKSYKDDDNVLLKAYFNRKTELSIHRGCLMWGIRVVIPVKLRKQIMELLHTSHPGISRMKSLARGYVWWAGCDKDLEILVKSCVGCQKQQKMPSAVNLHPWEYPSTPWERVHIDFAGPFLGKMFLIMVDAYSKWPEIIDMGQNTTAEKTINVMRTVFARNGFACSNC